MSTKTVLFAAAALAGAAYVSAQAAPAWQYIPSACSSACANVAEVAYLCETEYTSTTDIYGCYCNSLPSDSSSCATCLNSNNAAALGSLITSDIAACPSAIKSCFFACSFNTCASTDIACQCDATYLENIYNCGSCNTANGNTGSTQVSDWQALHDSCAAQNYTGAASTRSFTTQPLASATGQGAYVAATLTASGGGAAATGSVAASGVAPITLSGAQTGSSAAAAAGTGAAAISGASASGSKAAASGSAAASGAAAATTSKSAAKGLAAPAAGVLAVAGVVAALF
ncbi:hypothetical protein JCM24511_07494 [Saitozyma sp. JCM 24511]|nr:hypothetical protein JCM24511_07494 [Saitozyma sp. JCM 24511]